MLCKHQVVGSIPSSSTTDFHMKKSPRNFLGDLRFEQFGSAGLPSVYGVLKLQNPDAEGSDQGAVT